MNLEELNLVELNAFEMQEIEAGGWPSIGWWMDVAFGYGGGSSGSRSFREHLLNPPAMLI
ncbi:hypothetical protein [Flavobacterium sp. FlaQc-30]|uniref:hypothetical protein n=1 Tax=Flavobacterium sp. FlaQc-30 TaxID=3374179 RepID=UPI003757709F